MRTGRSLRMRTVRSSMRTVRSLIKSMRTVQFSTRHRLSSSYYHFDTIRHFSSSTHRVDFESCLVEQTRVQVYSAFREIDHRPVKRVFPYSRSAYEAGVFVPIESNRIESNRSIGYISSLCFITDNEIFQVTLLWRQRWY
jgi:hypothetical protein